MKYHTHKEKRKTECVHPPGIEPGSPAWQAEILPLDHGCLLLPFQLIDILLDNSVLIRHPKEIFNEKSFSLKSLEKKNKCTSGKG